MRQQNFKLGWFVPRQIAALIHNNAQVTPDDFLEIVQAGQHLVEGMENEFHILIDNRFVDMEAPATLNQIKQVVPFMNHPFLRWIVAIQNQKLALNLSDSPVEKEGQTHLKNVFSLPEAILFLRETVGIVQWQQTDVTFFPNIEVGDLYSSNKE